MSNEFTFLDFSQLDSSLLDQYRQTNKEAWPKIILNSDVVKTCWDKIESSFPQFQLSLVNGEGLLIGRINTIPFYWDKSVDELPEDGWDWLVDRGLDGFEKGIVPNCLGGLQMIVSKQFLGKGYSKKLIAAGKGLMETHKMKSFIVPIRPTLKCNHPEILMEDYMTWKRDHRLYDPWINNHVNSGAEIIKVCNNSMNVRGDVKFWENLLGEKISSSGSYRVEGGLNMVSIDKERNFGEYREDNIWIQYS